MKKVCHITSVHRNDDVRIFYKECTSLANAGYEVYLIAQGESCYKNGVQIIGVEESSRTRFGRMFRTTRLVYAAARKVNADIYHLHDPELLPSAMKLKKMGKKVVFDSHENYEIQILHKHYIIKPLRYLVSRAYKQYESYVMKHIDAAIIPCSFSGKNIFCGVSKRTVYIDNLPILKHTKTQNSLDIPNESNEPSICYIGGLSHDRGITYLIKAAYKAGARLILAGIFVSPAYHEELMKMPEYKCVDYRGFLDRNDIVKILRDSKIGICTILNSGQYNMGDNLSTKVYEYMSEGLPVIMTDSFYARKVMGEYEFGVCVRPDSVDEIVSAIHFLLHSPEIAKKMGENGIRAVAEKYNWGVEEKKLLKLYADLSGE